MKETKQFLELFQHALNEFMGDQKHSYVLSIHQCGDGECALDVSTNLDNDGVVGVAIELLETHAAESDLKIMDLSDEPNHKKTVH